MSRTPSTAHQTTTDLKLKTSKDSRTDDLRSPPKIASPSAYIKNSEKSPRPVPSGAGYACISLKSPEKASSTRPGSEKEVLSPEPKTGNKKEKEPKKVSSTSSSRKPSLTISVSSRPGSNQPRPHKGKSPSSATETQPVNNKLRKQEDIKTPLMTDTSEKMTPSGNLKLTLENISSKTGSLSHRVTLNSPAGSSNKFGGLSPVQNKGKPTSKPGHDNAKGQLNTLLIGATKGNYQKDLKLSKVSSKDVNSTTGTPRQGYDQSCEGEGEYLTMKKYKELLGMLQERDQEIKRLAKDKNQLQSTLSSMGEELKTLKQVNILFKERGKSGVDLDGMSKHCLQLEESSHLQTVGLNLTQSMQKSVDNSINRDFRPSNTPNGFIGAYHDGLKGLSDRTGKSWLNSLEGKVLTKEKRPNTRADNSSDNLQLGGRSSLTTSPNEESIRQRYDTLGEDADYVKEVGMESEKPQKKKKQSGKGTVSGHGSPRKPAKGAFKKKKREATSVDQGTSLIKIVSDHKETEQSVVKKKRPEFKSMEHFVFGPSYETGDVDIGEALSELKNRVEKLLRNKNGASFTKTQLLYQNLHERLQKAL